MMKTEVFVEVKESVPVHSCQATRIDPEGAIESTGSDWLSFVPGLTLVHVDQAGVERFRFRLEYFIKEFELLLSGPSQTSLSVLDLSIARLTCFWLKPSIPATISA